MNTPICDFLEKYTADNKLRLHTPGHKGENPHDITEVYGADSLYESTPNGIIGMSELNAQGIDCPLAIETSGHAALRDNYFLDDGAYLMVQIIILLARLRAAGKELTDLLKTLREPKEAREIRFKITTENFAEYGKKVLAELESYCAGFNFLTPAPDNREGFRVNFDKEHGNGWLLLRLSVHDPVMPLNIESDEEGGADKIEAFFRQFVSQYEFLC